MATPAPCGGSSESHDMDDPAQEIRALEERLLDPRTRRSAEELDALLADDFREFGSSGRVFDRAAILGSLGAESGPFDYQMMDFTVATLAPGVVLATYFLIDITDPERPRRTLRSSLWVRTPGGWRIVFHQGSHVPDEAPSSAR